MKTIIAGSRSITGEEGYLAVERLLPNVTWPISEVVCGMAVGVDTHGLRWAKTYKIPIASFPANWGKYGKQAGHIRNVEMAIYADALFVVWDGESVGTADMIRLMRQHKKPYMVFHPSGVRFTV
jgi:hypothetical protein